MTDFSFTAAIIQETICAEAAIVRGALTAPHVLMKPDIYPDGTKWCALLGDDLQTGISGFGDTPAQACAEFDKAFNEGRTPSAMLAERERG